MNKEAELPKSIDFSQLPEAPRAFKARKDTHTHTHRHPHTHRHGHTCMHTYTDTRTDTERERLKSERIMAPAVAVSLKTQFGLLRFPTGHLSSDERTHSEPARFCSISLASAVMHALNVVLNASHTRTVLRYMQRSNICVCSCFHGHLGLVGGKEKSVKNLLITKRRSVIGLTKAPL